MKDPENAKLLWGFLFEVRRFAMRLSPETEGVKRIKSTTFTIHVLEAPSGFVFVLTTENTVTKSLDKHLKYIYKNIFVEMVTKNPTQDPHGRVKSKVRIFIFFERYFRTCCSKTTNKHTRNRNLKTQFAAISNLYNFDPFAWMSLLPV